MTLDDGMAGVTKYRTVKVEGQDLQTIPVRVVGYEFDGKIYPSVAEANAHREYHLDGEDKVYHGRGPKEVVEDIEV